MGKARKSLQKKYLVSNAEANALRILALSPRCGVSEAMLLAHGVSIRTMVKLVKHGLAAVHTDRIARPSMVVARLTITDAGRETLAARAAT